MARKIDLHIHTNCSDGALTPKEVIDQAVKNDVSVIAIADHDTLLAYTDELIDYAKEKNITLIPAVEMSTRFFGIGFHVLGYNFNMQNEMLLNTLSLLRNARFNYLKDVSKKLQELGYFVDEEELRDLPTVTKAHISNQIVNSEKNEDLLLQEFGHIPSKGEFIETIMNENCPAFVEKFSISPIEASKIIHEAGGKVVLAHPVAYMNEDDITVEKIKELVKEMNADGIESNYIYVDRYNNVIDDTKFWNNFAKENNLFVTAGSDYHNSDGIRPEIGFINVDFSLSDDEVKSIIQNLQK